MFIQRFDQGWVIRTPAKVNLFLEVLGKREDGFHQIDTVMCPVTLFDELRFQCRTDDRIDFSVFCDGQGNSPADPAWKIPADSTNLVVRAIERVRAELGHRNGCCVTLHKRIPAQAGLGGGSSDAAAAIVAALIGWGRWNRGLALQIGAQLGSDIPLFLGDDEFGIGLARATGRGEQIEMLGIRPRLSLVITHPAVGASTAQVYRLWRPGAAARSCEPMLAALASDATTLSSKATERAMHNALQPAASQVTEWIGRQIESFAELGKPGAMMTGSGSACFALVDDLSQGQRLADNLIELGLPRAFAVEAWYSASIEQQLERISRDLP